MASEDMLSFVLRILPIAAVRKKKKKRKIIRNKAENDTHQYNANDK